MQMCVLLPRGTPSNPHPRPSKAGDKDFARISSRSDFQRRVLLALQKCHFTRSGLFFPSPLSIPCKVCVASLHSYATEASHSYRNHFAHTRARRRRASDLTDLRETSSRSTPHVVNIRCRSSTLRLMRRISTSRPAIPLDLPTLGLGNHLKMPAG